MSPNKRSILKSFKKFKFGINSDYKLPHGWDGNTSKRIVDVIKKLYKGEEKNEGWNYWKRFCWQCCAVWVFSQY